MTMLRRAFVALFAFALVATATDAHATHFRYGTIRWEKTAETPTDVTLLVTTESAWRCTYFNAGQGCPGLPAVVSTGQTLIVQRVVSPFTTISSNALNITRSSINTAEDWFVGSSQHTFTVNKVDLPVRIFWAGNARISSLRDMNNDLGFRVESLVSATPNEASPASSILPIITVGVGPAVRFYIPAADVENDTLTWSIAPTFRSGLNKAAPDGEDDLPPATLTIDSATGLVTWATDQEFAPPSGSDLYAVQFLVTDSKGAETPIDALLRIVPTTGTPPQALINGSSSSQTFSVRPNNSVTFTVTGSDVDQGASVTLNSGALPPGSSMTPTLPTTGTSPVNSVFNWTPTLAQAGNNFVVSFSATDDFGLQDTNSATITVLNNFPPVATCVAPVSVDATGPTGATTTITTTVFDQDGDGLQVQWFVDNVLVQTDTVPPSGGNTIVSLTRLYSIGLHPVRVEVSDGLAMSSCPTSVTVVDGPPTLVLPLPMILEATIPAGAVATFTATATDAVDGTVPVSCVLPSGSTFPLGINTVNCTATDSGHNTVTGSFTITVRDTIAPVISNMPGPITREATSPAGASASWPSPVATDAVDTNVPVICTPASGSTFAINPPGPVTTVTCTATDDSGNSSSATFTVTVVDTTPPEIANMPADMVVPGNGPTVVTWPPPTATDIVDGNVLVTCVPASGSTFPLGTTLVTCTARDTRNNASSRSFTVRVSDVTPPPVVVTLNPGSLWPPDHKMVNITVNVQTEPGATCRITAVTSNQPLNGTGDGDTDGDWAFKGMQLQLRRERAGNAGRDAVRVYTVTVECTDTNGNVGTGTATARVVHDQGHGTPGIMGVGTLGANLE